MLYLAAASFLGVLAVYAGHLWVLRRERDFWSALLAEQARAHAKERNDLLARIQAPDLHPLSFDEPDERKHYVSEADEDRRFESDFEQEPVS